MRLKDKVALFAGAGSNMSRATALLFAQEGAKIMLAARTKPPRAAFSHSACVGSRFPVVR